MRIPEFLKEEGCLGFVAPAFGCNIEPYQSGFMNALKKFNDRQISGRTALQARGLASAIRRKSAAAR